MDKQRFLITGGSQGIGAALAGLACTQGHDVVFTGRNQDLIDRVAADTGARGIRADVSDGDDNQRVVDTCVDAMGGIDVLVNNAAFGYVGELGEIDMAKMKELFDTNVFGLVDIGNRVAPLLKAHKAARSSTSRRPPGSRGRRGRRSTAAASGRCAASPNAGRPSSDRTAFG